MKWNISVIGKKSTERLRVVVSEIGWGYILWLGLEIVGKQCFKKWKPCIICAMYKISRAKYAKFAWIWEGHFLNLKLFLTDSEQYCERTMKRSFRWSEKIWNWTHFSRYWQIFLSYRTFCIMGQRVKLRSELNVDKCRHSENDF